MHNYKTFPVTVDYSQDEAGRIGEITLDIDRLPKGMNYCFAIGGKVLDAGMEWSEELQRHIHIIRDIELMEITLLLDTDYCDYLTKGYGADQLAYTRKKAKKKKKAKGDDAQA